MQNTQKLASLMQVNDVYFCIRVHVIVLISDWFIYVWIIFEHFLSEC